MRIVPGDEWRQLPRNTDGLVARSEQPVLSEGIQPPNEQLYHLQNQDSHFLEKISLDSRVIIVEGISGSGKDTFQTYVKKALAGRDVHEYSEGELLQSWNQLQIEGIFEVRVKFMRLFVNYVKDIVSRDENAVFLFEQISFVRIRDDNHSTTET